MNFILPVATFSPIIIWWSLDDIVAEVQFFSIFDVSITILYNYLDIIFLIIDNNLIYLNFYRSNVILLFLQNFYNYWILCISLS